MRGSAPLPPGDGLPDSGSLSKSIADAARTLDAIASAAGDARARRQLAELPASPATLAEAADAFETLAHIARALGDDGAVAGTLL